MTAYVPAIRRLRAARLWGSDQARELLESNRLGDIESVFSHLRPELCRHAGRAVVKTELTVADGRRVQAFAKLYFGPRRWWPRMTDVKTGQAWQSLPWREWLGIERLAAAGLLVPERLALFREGWLRPRSALIVAAVPAPHSVDDLLRSGAWEQLEPGDRDAIIDEMVAITRRVHAAGLAWRGICCRHFFPERQPDGRWRHWLIDLEGVHRRLGTKTLKRDLAKLVHSMRRSGGDERTVGSLVAKIEASGG